MKKPIIVAAALLAASTASQAQSYGVTASLGTTGIGVHVSRALRPDLNARIGANFFEHNRDVRTSDVDYDMSLRLRTVDALLDWFPTSSQFRVSGGLVYNANYFEGNGRANIAGSYTLNGNTYTAANIGVLRAEVDFRKIAPYLGIGWGNAATGQKGWSFAADAGVLFQGRPKSSLFHSGCSLPAAACTQLATDIAVENERLREELKEFRYYPVLRIGATYRF